jgi:hypothetical protein
VLCLWLTIDARISFRATRPALPPGSAVECPSPIAEGRRAHRPKPTELLDFDVIGSGGL